MIRRGVVALLLLAIVAPVAATVTGFAADTTSSPRQLLEEMRAAGGGIATFQEKPDWVQATDLAWLMQQLDSDAPSAAAVSTHSSHLPLGGSTVGAEAAFMVDGFRRGRYPPKLASRPLTAGRRDELRAWWTCWTRTLDRDTCEGAVEIRLDRSLVAEIEAALVLPDPAAALHDYTRYYAEDRANGTIMARYVSGPDEVRIVAFDGMPMVSDGGCGLIYFAYLLPDRTITPPVCNGDA